MKLDEALPLALEWAGLRKPGQKCQAEIRSHITWREKVAIVWCDMHNAEKG